MVAMHRRRPVAPIEPVRAREDRAGRRECHQRQTLHDAGEVDYADLGPAWLRGSAHHEGTLGARLTIASKIRCAAAVTFTSTLARGDRRRGPHWQSR